MEAAGVRTATATAVETAAAACPQADGVGEVCGRCTVAADAKGAVGSGDDVSCTACPASDAPKRAATRAAARLRPCAAAESRQERGPWQAAACPGHSGVRAGHAGK